ncbi:ABC transporter substrate-binding protein [Pseudoroseomonas wenyumeiae]
MSRLRTGLFAAALAAFPLLTVSTISAQAQDTLRIGMESGPTSLDPHYASIITNIAFSRHVFQPLMEQDARQVLRPAIAKAWRAVDDLTWEIALDPAARFHDGTPVTAEDVAFTLSRAGDVPNSPPPSGSIRGRSPRWRRWMPRPSASAPARRHRCCRTTCRSS